jgi:hypothetical protein
VRLTAEWVAEQRDADEDAVGDALVANYDRIFSPTRG